MRLFVSKFVLLVLVFCSFSCEPANLAESTPPPSSELIVADCCGEHSQIPSEPGNPEEEEEEEEEDFQ